MKILSFLFALWTLPLSSQNWVQVGNLNNTPRVFFNDTLSELLYISGNFRFNGIDTLNGLCTFDGDNFISLGRRSDCVSFGCAPGFLIARYEDYIYFSSHSLNVIDNVAVQGIASWDGTQWEPALPGLAGTEKPFLDGSYIHQGLFYGVGFFRTADGDTCNSVAYWNGQKWTGLGFIPYSDNGLPRVFKVIFYQDQLYVAGNFSWGVSGGQDIARLTNTGWELVGGGLYGGLANVMDMEVFNGDLYICGSFRSSDGNVGNKIMRWNGQEWLRVGDGFCAQNIIPTEMIVHKDKLYVVGIFDCVNNNILASNIASWDGERWCNLGDSYFNNKISSIAEYKGEIYVGGGFTEVDGQPCRFFAKYIGDNSTDTCSAPITTALEPATAGFNLSPNPTTDLLQIQAPAPIESVWVFDALGREVYRESASGERVSVPVGDWVPGLYFVVVRAGGEIWGGKFVKM